MTFLEYAAQDPGAEKVISTPDGVKDLIKMIPPISPVPEDWTTRLGATLVDDLPFMVELAGLARSEADAERERAYLTAWESAVDRMAQVPTRAARTMCMARRAIAPALLRVINRARSIGGDKSWEDFHAEDLSTILRVDAERLRSRAVAVVPNIHRWDGLCYDSWRGYANSVLIRVARARLEARTIPYTPNAPILGDAGDPLHVSAVMGLTQSGRRFIRQFGVYATTESVAHYTGTDIVEVSAIDYY